MCDSFPEIRFRVQENRGHDIFVPVGFFDIILINWFFYL